MPTIPNANIPCLVVQLNNTQFIEGNSVVGRVLNVPCKNDFIDDPDWWAVPIKDDGIFVRFEPIPVASFPFGAPPTFDSFPVMRVRDKLSGYTWWIYGTQNDFLASCASCCGSGAVPMPGTPGAGSVSINIAPCSYVCAQNAAGQFITVSALPALEGSEVYYPYGSYNGVPLPTASGAGYATPSLLLTYLNATWTNQGSPVAHFVWSLSPDSLTLIATGGYNGDELCFVIGTVGVST